MQFLVFHLGDDRYGIPVPRILRVLPLATLKALPGAPCHVAGLLNLHGAPVPVLDLCRLAGGAPCRQWFDTRILLAELATPDGPRLLGLIAERVSGIARVDAPFAPPGVAAPDAPWLAGVAAHDGRLLQCVDVERLLPEAARALLFEAAGAQPC